MSTQSHQTFMAIWNALSTIEFKKEWHNGTGYLNSATLEKLQRPVRFVDDLDRKGILLPTAEGSTVVFERYSDGAHEVIVCNSSPDLFDGSLSPIQMDIIHKRIDGTLTEEHVQTYLEDLWKGSSEEFISRRIQCFKEAGWIA